LLSTIDKEKRIALSEYKRNKDKKKIKRITNDLYETEDYEDNVPIDKQQPIDEQQDKTQPIITDEDFESNLKVIVDDNKDSENNKQDDN
jgi:hypothetical protein